MQKLLFSWCSIFQQILFLYCIFGKYILMLSQIIEVNTLLILVPVIHPCFLPTWRIMGCFMIILHVFSGWWLQITSVHSVWPNFYYHFSVIVLFLPGLWMLHPLLIEMVKLVPIYVCETFFFYEQLVGILVFTITFLFFDRTITFFIRKNLYTSNCCPCTVCSTSILCQCHSFDISSEISIHVWYILSVNVVVIVRTKRRSKEKIERRLVKEC